MMLRIVVRTTDEFGISNRLQSSTQPTEAGVEEEEEAAAEAAAEAADAAAPFLGVTARAEVAEADEADALEAAAEAEEEAEARADFGSGAVRGGVALGTGAA